MTQQQQRPPFRSLDADMDTDLERLAVNKGVGTLALPGVADRAGEGPQRVASPAAQSKPKPDAAGPTIDMEPINFWVPAYVKKALKIRAVEQQRRLRHVILTALRKDGIMIHDADMDEDGRRDRGKPAL